MPVRFDPPEPIGAAVISGLAREQSRRYARGSDSGYDGRVAVAAAAQRADAGQAQFAAQFARDQLQERQRQFDIEQANLFALQEHRAQLSAWASAQEMSNAESVRLQRLRNSQGAWQAMYESGRLTDDEYYDGLSRLQTGISPLEQKAERTRQQLQESALKENAEQAKRMALMSAAQTRFEGLTAQDRIVPIPPEYGGGVLVNTQAGKWDYQPPAKAEREVDPVQAQRTAEAVLKANWPDAYKAWEKDPLSSPLPADAVARYQAEYNKALSGGRRPSPDQPQPAGQPQPQQAAPPGGYQFPSVRLTDKDLDAPMREVSAGYYAAERKVNAAGLDPERRAAAQSALETMRLILETSRGYPKPGTLEEAMYQKADQNLRAIMSGVTSRGGPAPARTGGQ